MNKPKLTLVTPHFTPPALAPHTKQLILRKLAKALNGINYFTDATNPHLMETALKGLTQALGNGVYSEQSNPLTQMVRDVWRTFGHLNESANKDARSEVISILFEINREVELNLKVLGSD